MADAAADRLATWNARWAEGRTTFHRTELHPSLRKYIKELCLSASGRVIVPLCGKSVDLRFFAEEAGVAAVIGVDGAPRALEEFVAEQIGQIVSTQQTPCGVLHAIQLSRGSLDYLLGDFLHLNPSIFSGALFTAAFDRGGLVAVQPSDRTSYAATLARNLAPAARVIIVSTEHPPFEGGKLGPPHSIEENEIRALLGNHFDVALLERKDLFQSDPIWKERGCDAFYETTYLLVRNTESL